MSQCRGLEVIARGTISFLLVFCISVQAQPFRRSFNWSQNKFEIIKSSSTVTVMRNGKTVLTLVASSGDESSVIVKDYDFDGIPDIAISTDQGIERYFDVYVFDKRRLSYVKRSVFSRLACPLPDAQERTIASTCNHVSACESWKDIYKYDARRLVLLRRETKMCDPVSHELFLTIEIYSKGRVVRQNTYALPQGK